jgi:hypothetical protein
MAEELTGGATQETIEEENLTFQVSVSRHNVVFVAMV